MVGRKKISPDEDKSDKQISTVNGQDLNPGQKGDEILNSIFHFPVEEILGKEKDENVIEKPNESELSDDSELSVEELDIPKTIKDDDVELDLLNESTHSLSLKENLLSNLNQTIEENITMFKNFAQKSFEIQNQLIENQTNSINILEQMLSKSESLSRSENTNRNRQKAQEDFSNSSGPETALSLDIKTLKLIYPDEMNEIEETLKKLVNNREDVFKKYWKKSTNHKRTAYKEIKTLLIQLFGKKATSNLELKRQFTERVQNQYENVYLYSSQLKVLAKQSHPELLQYQINEQFIRGLRDKMLRTGLQMMREESSLEEIIDEAARFEKAVSDVLEFSERSKKVEFEEKIEKYYYKAQNPSHQQQH
ncbi:unnamed protein product [Brachionus calyciflorus]|uniref:Uncharacterized protein n=1 Tax=Brachionus calyciflorus TaxID=104777 RepID=A0A814GK54_9BILA|nr:unnamed protein product [Brachionus calyciflorus]